MEIKEIEMEKIFISKFNTRKDLDAGTEEGGIDDLAKSINEQGLLSPITVRMGKNDDYELIVGQRRFLACQKLGWKTIPAIVRDIDDDIDLTIISLVENVHRADMAPIDKAKAYKTIYEKHKTISKVAKETGVSATTISKYLKLLDLAPSIQEKLTTSQGPIGIETLSKLAQTFSQDAQEEVLEYIEGFTQNIQLEMLKKSEGDISKLPSLKEQALEGAFDTHLCRGLDECVFIPDELIEIIKNAIKEYKTSGNEDSFVNIIRKTKKY